jgi:hypothetical protein
LNQLFVLNAASAFSDVDANDRLSFTATGLPPGLSIDANGLITGIATRTSASSVVRITATDLSGLSTQASVSLSVVDVPGIIGVAAAPQADRLVHSGDSTSVVVNLTEAVNVQGKPLLNLLVNDQAVQADYVSGSGSSQLVFSFNTPSLGNGADIQVLGLDLANASMVGKNTGLDAITQVSAVRTSDITVDNTAPAAPTLALANDSGWDSTDGVSKPGDIVVGGLEPGAQWAYRTSASGQWVTGSGNRFALGQGDYSTDQIQVRQTDAAGNLGDVGSNRINLHIDSTAPTATVALELPGGASVLKANSTATVRLTLSEPLANLPLITSGAGALSPWQKTSDTEYTATFNALDNTQGEFDLNLGAFQDAAGNAGSFSNASAQKITIDTRPPRPRAGCSTTAAAATATA